VRIDKKRLVPEDKGLLVTAFLESFFRRYVEYDFTADLEEKLDEIANHEIDWKQVLRDFWQDFSAAIGGTKDLRTTEVLDSLNEILGPHIFPPRADGADPRTCPNCNTGQLSLKLGRYGAFVGCSNYPECRYTRQFIVSADGENGDGASPGVRLVGEDPATGLPVTVRDGRFGPFIQLGEAEGDEKPKRASIPKGTPPSSIDLERALKLLALPREVARHPETGEPILANIGRYGPYVQHGKTYATIGKDDDVLEIGANRAIDLIVAKESGASTGRRSDPGRALGEDPASGKAVVVKSGRYGPYVTDGTVNATLPRETSPDAVTLDEAIALLNARRAAGGGKSKRRTGGRGAKARATGAKKATAKKAASTKKSAARKRSAE
jgi:DNA topoisomerase-1